MTKFLDGTETTKAIKNLVKKSKTIYAAVAYWGNGASEILEGLRPNADICIICDLMSGACNPNETRHLLKTYGNANVLTLDKLHAKVWYTENGAIIGSSNISTNGLALEGKELSGQIEANIFIDDSATLEKIRTWFSEKIKPQARKIKDTDIAKITKIWDEKRANRKTGWEGNKKESLYEQLSRNLDAFKDKPYYVWVYEHDPLREDQKDKLKEEESVRGVSGIDMCSVEKESDAPPGAVILDFNYHEKREKCSFDSETVVLKDNPYIQKCDMALCRKPDHFLLKEAIRSVDKKYMAKWCLAAKKAYDSTDDEELKHLQYADCRWKLSVFAENFLLTDE